MTTVISNTPAKTVGPQAVDCHFWALQRFSERCSGRRLANPDLDSVESRKRGIFYTKKKALTLAALER